VYAKFLPKDVDAIRGCRAAAVKKLAVVAMKLPKINASSQLPAIVYRLSHLQYIEEVFNVIDMMQYRLSGVLIKPAYN